MSNERYFRVNYYIPDDEKSDGFEDAEDFYCKAPSKEDAAERLEAKEPSAAGVTVEEVSEAEFNNNAEPPHLY